MKLTDEELVEQARAAAENAYAPYSNFRVGAVVVAGDGSLYTGANVENAAYPSTLCAEAVAIGHAVASGARRLKAVAVGCLDTDRCYPCGQCRQRMAEFGVETVIVQDGRGGTRRHRLDELMPDPFSADMLEGDA